MTVSGLGDGWDGAHPLGSLSGGGAPEGQAWTTWTTPAAGLPDVAEDGCDGALTVSYLKEPRWDVRACRRHTDRPSRAIALPGRPSASYPSVGARPTMTDPATGQVLAQCAQWWTGSQADYFGQDYSNYATAGFRLWAPLLPYQLPDLAVDCDCPSPWGDSRIIWAGGIPHWVSRSDATGSAYSAATVRHPYQRTRTEPLFSATDGVNDGMSARLNDRGSEPLGLNNACNPTTVGRGFALYADDLPGLIAHVPGITSWTWCEADLSEAFPYSLKAGPTISLGGYDGPRIIGIGGTDAYGNAYFFPLGDDREIRAIERASVMPPPCWPWDVPRLALGEDDATVRYVGSCGWARPPHGLLDLAPREPESVTRSGSDIQIVGRTSDVPFIITGDPVRHHVGSFYSLSATIRAWCPATGDQVARSIGLSSAYEPFNQPPDTVSLPARCAAHPIHAEIDLLAGAHTTWAGTAYVTKRLVYDL